MTLAVATLALANYNFALASFFIIAFFWAGEALRSAFLSALTFYWALNCVFNAFFLAGSVAPAILAWSFAILFASTLRVALWNCFVALFNWVFAVASLI